MHWRAGFSFAVSLRVIWLAAPTSFAASEGAENSTALLAYYSLGDELCLDEPEPIDQDFYFVPNPQGGQVVYRGDSRYPSQVRQNGGFRPYGQGWENDDLAYIIARHYLAAPFGNGIEHAPRFQSPDGHFRTAYVSVVRELTMAELIHSGPRPPVWMYEIRATRNILDFKDWMTECFALGGIPWHQIRRYRLNQAGAQWQDNPDYNRDLFENTEMRDLHRISNVVAGSPGYDDTFPSILRDGIADPSIAYRPGALAREAREWVNSHPGRFVPETLFPFTWLQYSDVNPDVPGPQAQPEQDTRNGDGMAPALTSWHREALIERLVDTDLAVKAAMGLEDGIIVPLPKNWTFLVEKAGCSHWTKGDSTPQSSKRDLATGLHLTAQEPGNLIECSLLYMRAREFLLHNFGGPDEAPPGLTEPNSPLLANETHLLFNGSFGMLNCVDILGKIIFYQATLSNDGNHAPAVPRLTNNDDYCTKALWELRDRDDREKVAKKKPTKPSPRSAVFFGHFLWPDEAKRQGGFLPLGQKGKGGEQSPWSTYVLKASSTFQRAAKHAARLAARETPGFPGVVYAVHATPNIVSLGSRAAIVGGIRWSQVIYWRQLPEDWEKNLPRVDPSARGQLEQRFLEAFRKNISMFDRNPDYDKKYDKYLTSVDIIEEMVRVQDDVKLFMDRHGSAVGWTGSFPLFQTTMITGEASRKAKEGKSVPTPHSEGTWESMKEFAENHVLALMALPAVFLANFIPGAGPAADAAELAALTEESVEGIEIEEAMSSSMSSVGQGLTRIVKGAYEAL